MKSRSVVSDSLRPHGPLYSPWNPPGKNTGVGCYTLLQGIFPTLGLNPHLLCVLHWQVGALPLVLPGKPQLINTSIKKYLEFLFNVIQSMSFLCWKAFINSIPLELVEGLNPSSLSRSPLPHPPTLTPILDNLLIISQHSWPPSCGSFFQKSFYICWSLRHNWATSLSLFTFINWRRKWQPTPVFLPGQSQGQGSLVGCRLWGCTESDTTDVT